MESWRARLDPALNYEFRSVVLPLGNRIDQLPRGDEMAGCPAIKLNQAGSTAPAIRCDVQTSIHGYH